ncbi:MAG TPA: ABC transporter permease, partial [Caulobacteraceae bacterium]
MAGLAIGIAVVILTSLYIDDELSFDRFVPGHEHAYVVTSRLHMPGQSDIAMDYAPSQVAAWLSLEFPTTKVARLAFGQASVRRGDTEAREDVAWVDPDFFEILPLPALAGNPRRALAAPDSVVITRSVARKYFGRDAPIGEALSLDRDHPLRVTAVIDDLPPETHLTQRIFASSGAPFSPVARLAAMKRVSTFTSILTTPLPGRSPSSKFEYVRLRVYLRAPDARTAKAVATALTSYGQRHIRDMHDLPPTSAVGFGLVPVTALHLQAFKGVNLGADDVRGSPAILQALAIIAGLVLSLAAINFVNLTTAGAARRGVEIGVRKVCGAQRWQLIVQFVGETLIFVLLATVAAVSIVEMLLPTVNELLLRRMTFPYWR